MTMTIPTPIVDAINLIEKLFTWRKNMYVYGGKIAAFWITNELIIFDKHWLRYSIAATRNVSIFLIISYIVLNYWFAVVDLVFAHVYLIVEI